MCREIGIYYMMEEWVKGKRTGHDSEIHGPFPATNNNARLVFFFYPISMRISIYVLNFSSSLNI